MAQLRVALTGGIGSGKTAVSDRLAALGAVVIDADVLAREVVAPGTPGLAAVVARFGAEVLDAQGALDRPALGRRVFADAEARRELELIIHPLVRAAAAEQTDRAPEDAVVVQVIPLLVETGQAAAFDVVVVVDVDPDLQLARLVARGTDRDEAGRRIAAQTSRSARLAAADLVIDNTGDRAALNRRVDALWADLSSR